jgi:hypothetical protein
MSAVISEFYSDDGTKNSVVSIDKNTQCYFVEYYLEKKKINTEFYPGKSIHFAEDAAENYVCGIKVVECQLKKSLSII